MEDSSVVPDLLETMNSVLLRSTASSAARTWAGSVESRTRSVGNDGPGSKVDRRTSGHKLEPPIPSKRAWVNCSWWMSAENSEKALALSN